MIMLDKKLRNPQPCGVKRLGGRVFLTAGALAKCGLSLSSMKIRLPGVRLVPFPVGSGGRLKVRGRNMTNFIKMLRDDRGAAAAEYALILAIVGAAIAVAAVLLGGAIANAMDDARDCIENPPSSGGTC